MGSGASKGKRYQDSHQYGELYLQTDKTTYRPGETVTGTIHLDLTSQYPGHQLFLKLKGREVVHFLNKVGSGKNWHYTQESETKNIIKQNSLVYSWETSAPVGQFSIPFSFLLPSYLPASFYQHEYRFLAFIEYQLEAFLQPPPNTDFPKMKYKQPLTIREIPLVNNGDLKLEVTTPLKSCFCCNQGSNVLKADFEKNFYSCEEEIKVSVELDNSSSKMNCKKIYIVLVQKLELKAKAVTFTENMFKRCSEKKNYSPANKIFSESFTLPVPKFQSEFDYKIEFDKYKSADNVLRKDFSKHNLYNFVTSATKSSLISSIFSLKVYCEMDGVEASLPQLECPISILVPDSPPSLGVTAPPNWRPLVLERIHVAFSEHQKVGSTMEIQAMPGNFAYPNQVILETPEALN